MNVTELASWLKLNYPAVVKEASVGLAKVRVRLTDDSFLDIWFNNRGRYSFHWQPNDQTARLFRFDNSPHHPEISTHPHHFHQASAANIQESPVTGIGPGDFATVLDFISRRLSNAPGNQKPE